MSARVSFDDALDAAIDAVMRGEQVSAVVARYPAHAETMRPLVELAYASQYTRGRAVPPPSPRLAANFSAVEGAAQRARIVQADTPREAPRAPWWRQKLTFASMSIPAGIVALLAVAGISGAAAASVAVTSDTSIGERVTAAAHAVTPDWIDGGDSDAATAHHGVTGNGGSAPGGNSPLVAPGSQDGSEEHSPPGPPQTITESGLISDAQGNVFTLTNDDGDFHVNIDASTVVTGAIADGAMATVAGEFTGGQNLHATSVQVTSAPALAPQQEHPDGNGVPRGGGQSGDAPGQQGDATPGNSSNDHTPGPQADRTPGPQSDRTPSGNSGQPPGQSTAAPPGEQNGNNGNGQTSGQNNGNGGGNQKP